MKLTSRPICRAQVAAPRIANFDRGKRPGQFEGLRGNPFIRRSDPSAPITPAADLADLLGRLETQMKTGGWLVEVKNATDPQPFQRVPFAGGELFLFACPSEKLEATYACRNLPNPRLAQAAIAASMPRFVDLLGGEVEKAGGRLLAPGDQRSKTGVQLADPDFFFLPGMHYQTDGKAFMRRVNFAMFLGEERMERELLDLMSWKALAFIYGLIPDRVFEVYNEHIRAALAERGIKQDLRIHNEVVEEDGGRISYTIIDVPSPSGGNLGVLFDARVGILGEIERKTTLSLQEDGILIPEFSPSCISTFRSPKGRNTLSTATGLGWDLSILGKPLDFADRMREFFERTFPA